MNSHTDHWLPSASIENLLARAKLMRRIRNFFNDRGILEVDTPAMSPASITDTYIQPFITHYVGPGAAQGKTLYLITSPEFHMKRLLAAESGPIYQICHCFRNEEAGRFHNPEFMMLEWYRPGFDMYQLMNEVDDLLQRVLECDSAELLSYQQAFQRYLEIDPLTAEKAQLKEVATRLNLASVVEHEEDRDILLQLLFSYGVEPHIGLEKPAFIYHFPATQASLAQISIEDRRVCERFEVYYKGVELANGFNELLDPAEHKQRFLLENEKRQQKGLPQYPIDENLLDALAAGLPPCSGVALGLDRLIMLALNATCLDDIIAFPISRA